MIAGFIAPDSGDIAIGGRSMQGVAPNRRPVNMVFQQLALFPMMSVGENVAFGLARRGIGRAQRMQRSQAMLERVGLGGAAAKRVDELSGGQRQRVAIARSLVLEPTLLLLDEPLGALDLKLREHMKIELKQLQAAFGTTFVYITHDQSEALVLSDHVGVMSQGRFEQLGTPQDLYYRPQTPFVASFVGANNRIVGRVTSLDHASVEMTTADGWAIRALKKGAMAVGDAVEGFVRPEVASLGRTQADLPARTALAYGRGTERAVRRRQFRGAAQGAAHAPRISHRPAADRSIFRPQAAGESPVQLRSGARRVLCGARRSSGTGWLARRCRPGGRGALGLGLLLAPALLWLGALIILPHIDLAVLSFRERVGPRQYVASLRSTRLSSRNRFIGMCSCAPR